MMPLPDVEKGPLVQELRFIIDRMRAAGSADERLFFFSAIYGAVKTLFVKSFDPTLVLAWHIANDSHTAIQSLVKQRQEVSAGFLTEVMDRLLTLTEELAGCLTSGDVTKLYAVLEQLAVLAYSTTGNGRYLRERGILRFRDL